MSLYAYHVQLCEAYAKLVFMRKATAKVSLGHFEEKDLAVVLQHLRECDYVSSIGLWGRSMGAAASLTGTYDISFCIGSPFPGMNRKI